MTTAAVTPSAAAGLRSSPAACWASGWKGRMRWLKTYLDQQGRCAICRKQQEPGEMTKDHIVPRSKGGGTDWDNIQLVCEPCNSAKGDKMPNGEVSDV